MSGENRLFLKSDINNTAYQQSKMRYNRDYLISSRIAQEFNTYNYFGIFKSYNDVYARGEIDPDTGEEQTQFKRGKMEPNPNIGPKAPGVRSLFNRSSSMLLGGQAKEFDPNDPGNRAQNVQRTASEWRIYNNVPLIDSPSNRQKMRAHSACTVRELVQLSSLGMLGKAVYSYADFMYCKYLGRVPNKYLITLRRFPSPPGDNITSVGTGAAARKEGKNLGVQQIGCLVCWMGTPGNEMENILKYSVSMPYQEKSAKMETVQTDGGDSGGILNGIAAAFDPGYRKQYQAGYGGAAFNRVVNKFFPPILSQKMGVEAGPYQLNYTDGNKIYGPVDRVKKIYQRGEEGIDFKQTISLTFDYELRSYNGVNTRQAFLDLLANILSVTYTTGSFWGGGYRGGGMHQNSIFNNLNIFKARGGFRNFTDALSKDVENLTGKYTREADARAKSRAAGRANNGGDGTVTRVDSIAGYWGMIKSYANQIMSAVSSIGGMFLSGVLNKLGRPARAYADSLLSERPTGMWHVMIGNPKNPIMSMGNMVLKNTTIQHYGPLGLDDFPTGIRVVCELDRGKGRDLKDIEALYMHGNDRVYSSMSEKVLKMYESAINYKTYVYNDAQSMISDNFAKKIKAAGSDLAGNKKVSLPINTQTADTGISDKIMDDSSNNADSVDLSAYGINTELDSITGDDLVYRRSKLMHFFGETDAYSITFAAAEQEEGADHKKEPTTDKQNNPQI